MKPSNDAVAKPASVGKGDINQISSPPPASTKAGIKTVVAGS